MKKDICKNVESNYAGNDDFEGKPKKNKKKIFLIVLLVLLAIILPPLIIVLVKKFDRWNNSDYYDYLAEGERLSKLSKDELCDEYEQLRQEWAAQGGGDRTPEMERINDEINKRVAEEWMNNPNRNPDFHWTDANRWEKD